MGIWLKIIKTIITFGLNQLYNYVDKNKDGSISKDEINSFVSEVRKLLSRIKNKQMK